tara:strand:- start:418 stop:699 length:282 start_codon:yes stop_codon:yes gene_type:complete
MTVKNNQSTFDIVTQTNGDAKSILSFCLANDLSITETLTPGSQIIDYISTFTNEIVKDFFQSKGSELATANARAETEVLGIGNLIIGTNFDIL